MRSHPRPGLRQLLGVRLEAGGGGPEEVLEVPGALPEHCSGQIWYCGRARRSTGGRCTSATAGQLGSSSRLLCVYAFSRYLAGTTKAKASLHTASCTSCRQVAAVGEEIKNPTNPTYPCIDK